MTDDDIHARARRRDPDTSHIAAASIMNMNARHEAVLRVLTDHGPCNDSELEVHYHASDEIAQTDASIRSRRNELATRVRPIRVEYAGYKSKSLRSDNPSKVWRVIIDRPQLYVVPPPEDTPPPPKDPLNWRPA